MESSLLRSVYKLEYVWESFLTSYRIQVTSDGKYVWCMCSDKVNLIEIDKGGKIITHIEVDDDEILDIALSDSEMLILALKSGSLKIYDTSNIPDEPSVIGSFKTFHQGPMSTISTLSRVLATGSADGVVKLWDLQLKTSTHSMKMAGVISAIKFNMDENSQFWLYIAAENDIYIWSVKDRESALKAKLTDHYSKVTCIELHDEKHLVSAGLDKVIIIWNLQTFKAEKILPVYESISVMVLKPKLITFPQVPVEDENIHALVIGDKGYPSVWDVTKGSRKWIAKAPIVSMPDSKGVTVVPQMQLLPSLESIIITTYEHCILFLKYNTMNIWKQIPGHHDQIMDLLFCGDKDSHLIVATNSGQLNVFKIQNGDCHLVPGHTSSVMSLSRHPTTNYIFASSSNDNTARLWNLNGGAPICLFIATSHTHSVNSIFLSEDFFITASKDTCIKYWTFSKNELIENVKSVNVNLLNTKRAHKVDINCVNVTQNGKIIATGSEDKTVKIWDSDLSEIGILRGHKRAIWCIRFSPIDQIVATASSDSTIKLWSLSDLSIIKSFEEHTKAVLELIFVSNGKQILSTGSDGLLKLWSVREGVCTNTIEGHEGEVWALAASDKTIVTGGENATVYWWKDVTEEEEQEKMQKLASLAEDEQNLQNFVRSKKWKKALILSIRLNKPYRTLTIIGDLLADSPDAIIDVLNQLDNDDLASVLEYAQSWITQTRNLTAARAVLKYFMTEKTAEELEEIRGCKKAVAGILPYVERHAKRIAAYQQSSQIFDFVLYQLSLK